MKILALDESEHRFLLYVFDAHVRSGMPPEHLGVASAVFAKLSAAREFDLSEPLRPDSAEITPNGVALEFETKP